MNTITIYNHEIEYVMSKIYTIQAILNESNKFYLKPIFTEEFFEWCDYYHVPIPKIQMNEDGTIITIMFERVSDAVQYTLSW